MRRYRTIFTFVWLVALLPGLWAGDAVAQSDGPQPDAAEQDIIRRINAWRLSNDVWPLQVNPTLMQMATDQASYLAALPEIDLARIHYDRQGRNPRQRATDPRYRWPHYGREDQVAVAEIAAVGDARFAMQYWLSSDVHRTSALNPAYREVGAAAVSLGRGTLYIVVLGARPNVLPALRSPDGEALYLTSEAYRWAIADDYIHEVEQVQVLSPEGRILVNWTDWQPVIELSAGANEDLVVLYQDDTWSVETHVDAPEDIVMLPQGQGVAQAPTATSSPTATRRPTATDTPSPSSSGSSDRAERPTAAATSTPEDTAAASPSPTATPPTTDTADVALIYTRGALFLMNVSGQALDLQPLSLRGENYTAALPRWTAVYPVPLDSFPPRHCLSAQQVDVSAPAAPGDCAYVRSSIYLTPGQVFWRDSFVVYFDDEQIATCEADAGRCEFSLP